MLNREKKEGDDGASFVSWADTFHPERAYEGTDHPDDRWGIVWAEATLVDKNACEGSENPDDPKPKSGVASTEDTVIHAVAIRTDNDDSCISEVTTHGDVEAVSEDGRERFPCTSGNPVEILVGTLLTFTAVIAVWMIDLTATIIFFLLSSFYYLSKIFQNLGGIFLLFYGLFQFLAGLFVLVDAILLCLSVFIAELLAGLAYLLCGLFGGCKSASNWHQYTRKICHLTRWAFRGVTEGWSPNRNEFPWTWTSANESLHSSPSSRSPIKEDIVA